MKNGLKIQIIGLPTCINAPEGTPNPYVGMAGTVHDFDGKQFDLFTGNSWLVGVNVKTCKIKILPD